MKKYIVSANYRNRLSKKPWLVRLEDEKPDQAKEYSAVSASEVEFIFSDARDEIGFDCKVVARCNVAHCFDDPALMSSKTEGAVSLTFTGVSFRSPTRGIVKNCKKLVLDADKSIMAVL